MHENANSASPTADRQNAECPSNALTNPNNASLDHICSMPNATVNIALFPTVVYLGTIFESYAYRLLIHLSTYLISPNLSTLRNLLSQPLQNTLITKHKLFQTLHHAQPLMPKVLNRLLNQIGILP